MVAAEQRLPPAEASVSADAIPAALRRHGGTLRQVLALSVVGTLVLALFASRDLASWLDRMGGGPILKPLQRAAQVWDDSMATVGLTYPHDALRETVRRALDTEW